MESVTNTIYSLYRNTPFYHEWIVACLDGAWHGMLGDRIASQCRPLALRNCELVVEVFEKAWFPVLSGMKQELLQRIRNATGGEVRQLMFKMQPGE
jgi:hypothetical protein